MTEKAARGAVAEFETVAGPEANLWPWDALRTNAVVAPAAKTAQWAEHLLARLRDDLRDYAAEPANKVGIKAELDPESGRHIFRVTTSVTMESLKTFFEKSVADVVANTNAAPGQFAWQLACRQSAPDDPIDPKGVAFPICPADNPGWFTTSRFCKRMENQVSPEEWSFLETFQPYRGLDGRPDSWSGPYVHPLLLLQELANDHKHRMTQPVLLVPNGFTTPLNVTIVDRPTPFANGTFLMPDWDFPDIGTPLHLNAEVFRARLSPGTPPLIADAGTFEPQVSMAEGRPPVETLHRLLRFVQLILTEYVREFSAA